jgi:hypothetical protein
MSGEKDLEPRQKPISPPRTPSAPRKAKDKTEWKCCKTNKFFRLS